MPNPVPAFEEALRRGAVHELPNELQPLANLLFAGQGTEQRAAVSEEAKRDPDAVLPLLLSVATERELFAEGSPGDGWAPILAAYALADLGAREGASELLDALLECDPNDILYSALQLAAAACGSDVVEPALARLARAPSATHRATLLDVLTSSGVRDERIFTALMLELEEDPFLAAGLLGQYGDARARPVLSATLDELGVDEEDPWYRAVEIGELAHAIRALGGEITDEQADKLVHASTLRRAARDGGRATIGRNEPCPCRSGKKYKRCHGAAAR